MESQRRVAQLGLAAAALVMLISAGILITQGDSSVISRAVENAPQAVVPVVTLDRSHGDDAKQP
jgi:ABC-type sugar transport system substrate-binding protein